MRCGLGTLSLSHALMLSKSEINYSGLAGEGRQGCVESSDVWCSCARHRGEQWLISLGPIGRQNSLHDLNRRIINNYSDVTKQSL